MTTEPSQAPAWSRPPFEPGNELAVKHGAYSERRVAPLAAQIEQEARSLPTWPQYLNDPVYGPAIASWSRSEAVVELMWRYLAEQDVEAMVTEVTRVVGDEEMTPADRRTGAKARTVHRSTTKRRGSVLAELARWEGMAAARRARLGLDPLSRARLGKDVTAAQVDLVELLTRSREDAERAQAGRGGPDDRR